MAAQEKSDHAGDETEEYPEKVGSNPECDADLSDGPEPLDHRFGWARTVRFVFEFRVPGEEEEVCIDNALQGLICFAAEASINRCLDTIAERHKCKLHIVVSRQYALTPNEQLSSSPCEEPVPCPTRPPRITVMAPTVHVNGTAYEVLLEQNLKTASAVGKAIESLGQAAPNGRDYYPQGAAAIRAAMEQHVQRVRRLQSVYDELERIAELIADATCIHTREPEATRRLGLVTRVSTI
jgi:hypothetical protein